MRDDAYEDGRLAADMENVKKRLDKLEEGMVNKPRYLILERVVLGAAGIALASMLHKAIEVLIP